MATKTRHDLLMERIRSQYEGNKVHSPKQEEEEKNDRNWLGKVGATGADILDSLGTGIAKGLEGVVDAGATLAGNVGSWFGADDDWAEDFVAKDHVGTFKQNNMQGWNDYIQDSYVYDMSDNWEQIIHGSVQSIGNMLPAIALNFVPVVGPVASKIAFGASAMGSGVEQGLQQGHDFQTATNYGILQAGKEMASEAIGAKLFDSKWFGVLGKSVGKTGARNLVKEVGKQAFGEGMEEVIGGAFEPLIQKLTISKDENVWDLFGDAVRQMPMDFISGALTGALMNGGTTVVNVAQHGTNGVKAKAVVEDAHGVVNEIVELEKKHTKLGDERFNERYKVLQNELVELSKEYEGYMSKINAKYGEGSLKAKAYESGSKYLEDMKSLTQSDIKDMASVDSIKNSKKNINYTGALDHKSFIEKEREIYEKQGKAYNEDEASDAFIVDGKNIYFDKDSEAYKSGKIYNVLGHEIIHSIENTAEYKEIYSNYIDNLTETQKEAILKEYKENKGYTELTNEAIFKESFADYIGENVATDYQEFARMIGANSKWSKVKDALFGYKGVLSGDMRTLQKKVNKALKTNSKALESESSAYQAKKNKKKPRIKLTANEYRGVNVEMRKYLEKTGETLAYDKIVKDNDTLIFVEAFSLDENNVESIKATARYKLEKLSAKGLSQLEIEEIADAIVGGYYDARTDWGKTSLSDIVRNVVKEKLGQRNNSGSYIRNRELDNSSSNIGGQSEDDGRGISGNNRENQLIQSYRSSKKETTPKTIEIKEDYDASKDFTVYIEGWDYKVKGLGWYEKKSNRLIELEEQLNDEEITENQHYQRSSKIEEDIEDAVYGLDDILDKLESIDIEELEKEGYLEEDIPSTKEIEKLLNYASKVQEFVDESGTISIDFSPYLDEESNIRKLYEYLENKKSAEQKLKEAIKTSKPKVEKPKVENKIVKKNLEPTVQKAYDKIETYEQKYGPHSSFEELEYELHLTRPETAMLIEMAYQNGKIDESYKESLRSYFKIENLDGFEEYVKAYELRNGEKPKGVEAKAEEVVEVKEEKVVNEKAQQFTNSYVTLLTEHANFDKDSITGDFSEVFNDLELEELNEYTKRIFEENKTNGERFYGIDFLNKNINSLKAPVSTMEDTIMNVTSQFDYVVDTINKQSTDDINKLQAKLEILKNYRSAFINFANNVIKNKRQIFYNIEKDGVKTPRKLSGKESDTSRNAIWESCREDIDNIKGKIDEFINQFKENIAKKGKEVTEYDGRYGRKVVDNNTAKKESISNQNVESEGNKQSRIPFNNESNVQKPNSTKQGREVHRPKSEHINEGNNGEIQHTDVQTTRGKDNGIVEEPKEVKQEQKPIEKTEEVVKEVIPVEEVAETTGKEPTVVKEIKKVIIQNTRKVSVEDNAKTLKYGANLYNKKVYSIEGDANILRKKIATELKEKYKISFRALGEGYEALNHKVMATLNSIDNITEDQRIDTITGYFLEHIKTDNAEAKQFVRNVVSDTVHNGGKPSLVEELRQAHESKNAELAKEKQMVIDDYYKKLLKQIDITNTYKQLVKELTAEFKTLTKSKNVDEKKIAKLEERIKKLTTEFNSRLDSKDKYANQLKEELRALKKQVSAKNVEINSLKNENKALEKGKERAERKKATAMTASYGQKVIDSSFYKMIDEFDFSELVGEGYTIEKPKFDSSFYDKITSALSKNQIDYAVKLFTDRIAEYDVVDKNGNKTKFNKDIETWKEFGSDIKHAFTEFFENANKTPVQKMKEDVQKEHEIMRGTVALITTTNTIKNKLKKKNGVSQPLNKLAVDFVSDIAKPSLTSVRNGMYREAIGNAYDKLIEKINDKTLIERFGVPFDNEILEKMKGMKGKTGDVTVEEINDMIKIARYVSAYLSKASGAELITFNGQTKTAKEWAIEGMQKQKKLAGTKKTRKWLKRLSALRPDVVFKYMDGFDSGINTYFFEKLLEGESKEQKTFVELFKKISSYYETENGKAIKKMINKEVTIGEVTATVGEFMSIWKLLNRDEARTHIANSGFSISDSKGKLREYHFNSEKLDNFQNALKEYFDFGNSNSIYSEYIKKTTEFFEYAKKLKIDTDLDVKGYTNVIDGEYFPIKVVAHDRLTQMGEGWDFMSSSMQGSREYSFNSSVEGLKGILEVANVEQVMQVYATQLSRYVGYAKTIDNINSIYNYTLTANDAKSVEGLYAGESLRNVMANVFGTKNGISNVTNYYNTLLKDVQGIKTVKDGWFEKLRSKFATFQLGANLKVMANQFSAMPTALKYIKPQNLLLAHKEIAKLGLDIKLEDMPYEAQYRIMSKSMLSANTLNQKVGKVANIFGKGMEFTDNLVIKTIWKASLIQCNNNVAEATELFNKTIRETQGFNTLERSSLLRSENSLIKSMMMFTIQPSHNLSNLMEWWLHLRSGKKMTKADKTKYAGAIGGLLMEGAIYTAIGLLFKRLLGKDEDDEYEVTNILETFFNDNLMGMIPFLNNIEVDFDMTSGKLLQMNDFSVGAIGQLYDAFDEMQNVFDTDSDPMAKLKSLTYATGMVTGIPTRNINNYTTALLKICGVEGAYDWEILSSGKSLYNKEAINDALDRNQSKKAWKYYEAYTDKIVDLDEKTTRVMYDLYADGYSNSYLKQVPYTINGVDSTITTDLDKFRATYSDVGATLKKVTTHPSFTALNDAKKQKIIKQVVDTHYNIAYKEQSGEALTTMEMLVSKGYNPTRTFIWLSEISEIKETYSMTRKEAVQKYINRLPLMSNEKYLIYMLAGYKLTDDKVVLVKNFLRMKGLSYKDINQIFG